MKNKNNETTEEKILPAMEEQKNEPSKLEWTSVRTVEHSTKKNMKR